MPTATVTSKGQVTIPKAVRDRLQLEAGDEIDFMLNERGDVVVRPVSGDVHDLRGILERPRRRAVTVEQMNAAILREHKRKR